MILPTGIFSLLSAIFDKRDVKLPEEHTELRDISIHIFCGARRRTIGHYGGKSSPKRATPLYPSVVGTWTGTFRGRNDVYLFQPVNRSPKRYFCVKTGHPPEDSAVRPAQLYGTGLRVLLNQFRSELID